MNQKYADVLTLEETLKLIEQLRVQRTSARKSHKVG